MHVARKRFGQNFLVDQHVIAEIITAIHPKPSDILLEIGPGLGALTLPLLDRCKKLYAIELDKDIIPLLKEKARLHGELILEQGDVLQFKFTHWFSPSQKVRCVGNLPYNISSPLIFHLLAQREFIADMYFMLQKEMVERITAQPNSKAYGRISVMVQYYCRVEHVVSVSPAAFQPSPQVDSAVIWLKPYHPLPVIATNEDTLALIVRTAFNQRRKTISNSLKHYVSATQLRTADIDPKRRAETLSVAEFVHLANFIAC